MLVRLEQRGYLKHHKQGVRYLYSATLLLPAATFVLPAVEIRLAPIDAAESPSMAGEVSGAATGGNEQDAAPPAPHVARPLLAIASTSMAAWAIGTVVFVAPIAIGIFRRRQLRRGGLPWLEGRLLLSTLAREVGILRDIELLRHEHLDTPMTCGVTRAAILLPMEASGWSDDDLRRALLHELEHVKRADTAVQLCAELACALYWFHPLAWMAARRLHLNAELACDDAVVRVTTRLSTQHNSYGWRSFSLPTQNSRDYLW
jgi:beta-lactamase regulating signal transducer with metallopeptidase domain